MSVDFKQIVQKEIKALFELKKTVRLWHVPFLASLCVGIPLLIGYFLDRMDYGILSCMSGLVILYLPGTARLTRKMITLLTCSFGFVISFVVGISFSFNPIVSSVVIGLFAMCVHWIARYFKMKPPGSFFFIMIAAIASCMPFDLMAIPTKVGLIALGAMLACMLALIYSLIYDARSLEESDLFLLRKRMDFDFYEVFIFGFFVGSSIAIGKLLNFENPYWLPISSMAVMNGVNFYHVWQRSFQRILGTFLGLGLAWLLLIFEIDTLGICISIMLLQFIVEMLIVRHYGLAVLFITPLTLFLAEAGSDLSLNPSQLIYSRFIDILIGSCIGAIGGWVLHHNYLKNKINRQFRKTRISVLRK